jgi:hypothetical protein
MCRKTVQELNWRRMEVSSAAEDDFHNFLEETAEDDHGVVDKSLESASSRYLSELDVNTQDHHLPPVQSKWAVFLPPKKSNREARVVGEIEKSNLAQPEYNDRFSCMGEFSESGKSDLECSTQLLTSDMNSEVRKDSITSNQNNSNKSSSSSRWNKFS